MDSEYNLKINADVSEVHAALPVLREAAGMVRQLEPVPGYKSTEGAAALVGIGGPLLTALLAHDLTWQQLVALGIVGFVACVYIIARTWLKKVGVALLILCCLASPAHAGPPESTPRAPMPADIAAVAPAVPPVPPALIEAARVQAIVSAALASAQQGVATLPPSWMDSKAGQVLIGCIAGAIVITSAAGAGIGAGLAFGK